MYMPNANILHWGPNATYIPLEMGFALATNAKVPNASSFASQWNIGFNIFTVILESILTYLIFWENF